MRASPSLSKYYTFPDKIIFHQIAAKQPSVWICTLFFLAQLHLTTLLDWIITIFSLRLPDWYTQTTDGILLFSIIKASIFIILFGFGSRRYSTSLWAPSEPPNKTKFLSLIIFLPLLLYYLSALPALATCGITIEYIDQSTALSIVADSFKSAWKPFSPSPTYEMVAYWSLLAIISAPLEEMLFRGFILNKLAKTIGLTYSLLISSLLFSLVHIFSYGVGYHFIPLFIIGLTLGLMRLSSGSLTYSIAGHITISALILAPKLFFTFLHYKLTSRPL